MGGHNAEAVAYGTVMLGIFLIVAAALTTIQHGQRPRMAAGPVLTASGLAVGRGGQAVASGIDLALHRGELVAVLGPNGAGKSTLLATLAGLLEPVAGRVEATGRVAAALQAPALARRSVRANVEAALGWWGVPKAERAGRRVRRSSACRSASWPSDPPDALSGGEARRVHLARAIALRADVLLLDEPFAGVDAPTRAALLRDAASVLRDPARATFIVLHDRAEAWALADRLIVLLDGALAASGPPQTVLERPPSRAVATFLGFTGAVREAKRRALPASGAGRARRGFLAARDGRAPDPGGGRRALRRGAGRAGRCRSAARIPGRPRARQSACASAAAWSSRTEAVEFVFVMLRQGDRTDPQRRRLCLGRRSGARCGWRWNRPRWRWPSGSRSASGWGRAKTRRRRFGTVIANAGLGLPPVVLGVYVAISLYPASPLGRFELLNTLTAVIIAQTLLSLPIVVALTAAAVSGLPAGLLDQAQAFGASRRRRYALALREARVGVIAAVLAALLSALAEVGAVVIVGGNLRGSTNTLASTVLLDLSASDPAGAMANVLVLLALVLVVGGLFTIVQQRAAR